MDEPVETNVVSTSSRMEELEAVPSTYSERSEKKTKKKTCKLFRQSRMNAKAEKQFQSAILDASAFLTREFHTSLLEATATLGPEDDDGAQQHAAQIQELIRLQQQSNLGDIKKFFVQHLIMTGKSLELREYLREIVTWIVEKKCTRLKPNGIRTGEEYQDFLHQIYLCLIGEMHETLNSVMPEELDADERCKNKKERKQQKKRKSHRPSKKATKTHWPMAQAQEVQATIKTHWPMVQTEEVIPPAATTAVQVQQGPTEHERERPRQHQQEQQRVDPLLRHSYGKETSLELYKNALHLCEDVKLMSDEFDNTAREEELVQRLKKTKPVLHKSVLQKLAEAWNEKLAAAEAQNKVSAANEGGLQPEDAELAAHPPEKEHAPTSDHEHEQKRGAHKPKSKSRRRSKSHGRKKSDQSNSGRPEFM